MHEGLHEEDSAGASGKMSEAGRSRTEIISQYRKEFKY